MRWLWFLICAVLGLVLLAGGLLVPMHLRAVDAGVRNLFAGNAQPPADSSQPFTDFIIRQENRDAALAQLRESPVPAVQELLRSRSLNNTALFPPSSSASG